MRAKAARDGCDWETAIVPTSPPNGRFEDPVFRYAFARIVTHYFRHGSWLDEGAVLRDAAALAGIPGVVVQGSLDLSNLLGTPWQLAAAWRRASCTWSMTPATTRATRSARCWWRPRS